jgi:hypothetical protein
MKKYNRKKIALGVLAGAAVAFSGVAFAANDTERDFQNEMRAAGQHHGPINQEAVEALEQGDFETFKKVAKGKRAKKITRDDFEIMVEMHQAKKAGQ